MLRWPHSSEDTSVTGVGFAAALGDAFVRAAFVGAAFVGAALDDEAGELDAAYLASRSARWASTLLMETP